MPFDKVERCECGSPLFLDWGLQVISSYDYRTPAGRGRSENFQTSWAVKICAMCDRPYGVWDGDLHDLSEIISQEDVRAVILRLEKAPKPAKATVRDP